MQDTSLNLYLSDNAIEKLIEQLQLLKTAKTIDQTVYIKTPDNILFDRVNFIRRQAGE